MILYQLNFSLECILFVAQVYKSNLFQKGMITGSQSFSHFYTVQKRWSSLKHFDHNKILFPSEIIFEIYCNYRFYPKNKLCNCKIKLFQEVLSFQSADDRSAVRFILECSSSSSVSEPRSCLLLCIALFALRLAVCQNLMYSACRSTGTEVTLHCKEHSG